jgi:hypothetical protein
MTKKGTKINEKRIREASENLKDIQKTIEPFVQPRKIEFISTTGKWQKPDAGENITRDETLSVLGRVGHPVYSQPDRKKSEPSC